MFTSLKCRSRWTSFLLVLFACLLTGQVLAQHNQNSKLRQKIAPGLVQTADQTPSLTVRVKVKDKTAFLKWMKEQQVQTTIAPQVGEDHVVISNLTAHALQKLLQNPWTTYVDKPNRVAKEEIELRDADFTVNKVYSLQSKYPQLTGAGFAVSVKEEAFDPSDIDLLGRTLDSEKNGNQHSMHATTMATLIAGAGNSGPNGKGVAPRAKLAYSNFSNLLPDNSADLLAKGISVQNHSYGVGVENYYGIESAAYDKQTFEHPELLHIFSSGNSGDKADATGDYATIAGFANLTGQFKTSKNTLSVGALDPNGKVGKLSSKGPAYDGRVKPELVAHGKGGTSEAAAVVSGIALLVQQAYAQQHGGVLPPSALVKAALINSADDVGRPAVDFESGFGNTDALGAVRTILENNFFTAAVSKGQKKKFILTVPEGAGMLKVTLVWHEAEASPTAQKALLNDLDITLRNTASNSTWQPWVLNKFPHPDSLRLPAKRGIDRVNNVEQITIDAPAAGIYELLVNGTQVLQGTQEFSLVYEFENTPEWIYPARTTALLAAKPYTISWQAQQQDEQAKIEYRDVTSQNWTLIEEHVDLAAGNFNWQTPDTAAVLQLRLVYGNGVLTSEEFIISKLLELKVGFNCEDQVMVHWARITHAQHYQLYQMGAQNLEPLITTSDTLAILYKGAIQNLSNLIAVAPVLQNKEGYSSTTIATDQTGVACYIRSFLPKQFVLEQVALQLDLSTLYDLASITLERQVAHKFEVVNTQSPSQLSYELQDPVPLPGKNTYRVKLLTASGKTYYSHTEEIFYANNSSIQIYPNPVAVGEPISVVVASASAHIQLYDRMGRLLYEATEESVIKHVPTDKLPKGLYILRVQTDKGTSLSSRVIIY